MSLEQQARSQAGLQAMPGSENFFSNNQPSSPPRGGWELWWCSCVRTSRGHTQVCFYKTNCPSLPLKHGQIKYHYRASLVAQWLRICLPMQGTQVQALAGEDPTCRRATKPVLHNYWACTLEPASHNYWAHMPQLLKPACLEPVLRNKRSHDSEKPAHCNKE